MKKSMNLNFRKIISKIKNLNTKKYKYDDMIDHKINNIKNVNDEYKIDKYVVNRKIPNKDDLKEIYNNFMKGKHINLNSIKFMFDKKIENLVLKGDNQYILLHLNLQKNKRYKLSLYFETSSTIDLNIVLSNNIQIKSYKNNSINGYIHFNTNHKHLIHYEQLYILFNKETTVYIKNFNLNIQEINNNNDYNITLIKNNKKITIF